MSELKLNYRSHQFHDLQPYVCTYEACITGSRLYGSQRDWKAHLATHENQASSTTDTSLCPLCTEPLRSRPFYEHLCRELQELSLFVVPSELFDAQSDSESDLEAERVGGLRLEDEQREGSDDAQSDSEAKRARAPPSEDERWEGSDEAAYSGSAADVEHFSLSQLMEEPIAEGRSLQRRTEMSLDQDALPSVFENHES